MVEGMDEEKGSAGSDPIEKLVSLCKRRGYIFPSSEVYGGINSCYDYGPLGVELKNNVKRAWWQAMTLEREDVEGLDAAILMHPRVWEASGHVENFTDPLVDCKKCKTRFRADELSGEAKTCPKCGGAITEARKFNLMFRTFMGPVEDSASVVYLRPETAQGIYVNFLNVATSMRRSLPFGIAQIGKAFRNEITPGNFTFRTREFEQMEMQYFVLPGSDKEHMEKWRERRMEWYRQAVGIRPEKLRWHQHGPDELAHYALSAWDIQYEFPFGWKELEGVHNRGDYDLGRHQKFSGKRLTIFDEATKQQVLPYIIETSAGCDRTCLVVLVDAYAEEEERVVLRLSPKLAPFKAAVFPLVNRDGMQDVAKRIADDFRKCFRVFYDDSGSIGRRYRRQDEAGTPFCITIDSETLSNQTVTVRDRDSMKQEKIASDRVKEYVKDKIGL